MLRPRTCITLGLLLLTACGGGGGSTESTGPSSSSEATGTTGTPGTTATTTTTTTTTDASTTSATTVADTDAPTSTAGTGTTGDLPDGTCREDADCTGRFESCFAPGAANCGDCQSPAAPCADNTGCEPGFVCLPFDVPCACGGSGEGDCVAACQPDSCGPEAPCNVMTGACEPLTCTDDGVICPAHFDCVPGSGGDDCVRQACSGDADCGGAPCVEGQCYEAFGECQPPAA